MNMLNITYKNQVKQVPVGTKLIDFLDETEKTNYIVCRVGLQIKELNYALQRIKSWLWARLKLGKHMKQVFALLLLWHFIICIKMLT